MLLVAGPGGEGEEGRLRHALMEQQSPTRPGARGASVSLQDSCWAPTDKTPPGFGRGVADGSTGRWADGPADRRTPGPTDRWAVVAAVPEAGLTV
ncbi:DNA lyase [Streptomyces laurentii]|uniref:DNA lyase n=1 Tax=Streptomyces laurentii TaxID=39478 RepID=A0A160P0K5_STRLU|nr:DNA lyase [Streptomyces laurentii]